MTVVELRNNPELYWKRYGWKGWSDRDVLQFLRDLFVVYGDKEINDRMYDPHRFTVAAMGLKLAIDGIQSNSTQDLHSIMANLWVIVTCNSLRVDICPDTAESLREIEKSLYDFKLKLNSHSYQSV